MDFDVDEIEDTAIIQFGCFPDRLLSMYLLKRERQYIFPLYTPFLRPVGALKYEWDHNPFPEIYIQDPSNIDSLTKEFHAYNHLPQPPEALIKIKASFAVNFHKYLLNRVTKLFRGTELVSFEQVIQQYIRDASTGDPLPPLGLLEDPDIAPIDLAYIERLHNNILQKMVDLKKVSYKSLKMKYPVHQVLCSCCDKPVPCPFCGQTELLRGWAVGDDTVALCYFCGTLFHTGTNEIFTVFDSDREVWGASAIAFVGYLSAIG